MEFFAAKLAKARVLIPAIAILSPLTAHAALFAFNFSFANGSWVSGQLTGTQVGQTVVDISNISATINVTGVQESRSNLFALGFNAGTGNWDSAIPVVLSTNVYQNNFLFTDNGTTLNAMYFDISSNPASLAASASAGVTTYMWGVPVESHSTSTFAVGQNEWYLTPAVPVPESDVYVMMTAGLGLLGIMLGRRKPHLVSGTNDCGIATGNTCTRTCSSKGSCN